MKRATIQMLMTVGVLLLVAGAFSQRHHSRQASQGQPGVFDYYLLTLSWSPEFCHSHPDKPECQSGHHGFVVHGLWPQYANGYPEHCSNAPGLSNPSEMTDIMPDAGLVTHEWSTHGTCSGLDADSYFRLLRRAFTSIKIPGRFATTRENFSIAPDEVKREFVRSNPPLSAEDMTVSCGNNYLTAVSVCLSKDFLRPIACQNLRDCRANVIRVPRIPLVHFGLCKPMAPCRSEPWQFRWCKCTLPNSSIDRTECEVKLLPAARLQHVGFVERADGQSFHRSLQVFTDLK